MISSIGLQTDYRLITNWLQTDYKLITDWLQTDYKLIANWLQTDYKLITNWLQQNTGKFRVKSQQQEQQQSKVKDLSIYSRSIKDVPEVEFPKS